MTQPKPVEPESVESLLRQMLSRLGLPDPSLIEALRAEWNELTGEPWAGQSQPAYLRKGELVVTVAVPSLIALLRYSTGDLLRRLDARFGEEVISSVRVVSSPRAGKNL